MEAVQWQTARKPGGIAPSNRALARGSLQGESFGQQSKSQARLWAAYLANKDTNHPHVELRLSGGMVIVSLKGGYAWGSSTPLKTSQYNIHLGTNQPMQLTWADWGALRKGVDLVAERLQKVQQASEVEFRFNPQAPVLSWGKPKQIMTEKVRRETYQSDTDMPGTWMPNMSAADVASWKGKLTRKTTDFPQVEIRKDGTVFIVSRRGGYKYRRLTPSDTMNFNLHIASSRPLQLNWQDWANLKHGMKEGIMVLANLAKLSEQARKKAKPEELLGPLSYKD